MRYLFIGVLFLLAHSSANAALLYDNGVAIGDSNRCAETSGRCSGEWALFDDFTLSNSSTIEAISWTANLYGGSSDYIGSNISIYDADPVFSGGSLLFSISSLGTLSANSLGGNFFDITVNSLSETLMAGTYWLGMQNDTLANYGTIARSSSFLNATQWQNDGAGFRFSGQPELSFRIEGQQLSTVPAPAAVWLIGAGLIGLIGMRKKSPKAVALSA